LGKVFARKPSYDSESSSLATTASDKLVEPPEPVSEVTQVCCFCLLTRLCNYVLKLCCVVYV
ncbi:unnamed protein product, partial [Brassica oleracea]